MDLSIIGHMGKKAVNQRLKHAIRLHNELSLQSSLYPNLPNVDTIEDILKGNLYSLVDSNSLIFPNILI